MVQSKLFEFLNFFSMLANYLDKTISPILSFGTAWVALQVAFNLLLIELSQASIGAA